MWKKSFTDGEPENSIAASNLIASLDAFHDTHLMMITLQEQFCPRNNI
jgi:hypothetical protein